MLACKGNFAKRFNIVAARSAGRRSRNPLSHKGFYVYYNI